MKRLVAVFSHLLLAGRARARYPRGRLRVDMMRGTDTVAKCAQNPGDADRRLSACPDPGRHTGMAGVPA